MTDTEEQPLTVAAWRHEGAGGTAELAEYGHAPYLTLNLHLPAIVSLSTNLVAALRDLRTTEEAAKDAQLLLALFVRWLREQTGAAAYADKIEVDLKRILAFQGMTREQRIEARRLAAAEELKAGAKVSEVARRYGVGRVSVQRWKKKLRRGASLAAAVGRSGFPAGDGKR